ncbi:hypothetical protein SAMN05444673_1456 [Bacillus sp. OV166]|uniref:hypothetical protein n=1 Tax=Bacillus sp. OV166 TaxID=1882763 RepID=UPI000A2ABFFC|nr:hypothetical protein [Bacillus sp. OV166]SMQ66111.1 hypothetical protein SAMN05444673_1456 [Bacillus sp. OV166]
MSPNIKITILSGHFGSGKTEIAINLALTERQKADLIHVNSEEEMSFNNNGKEPVSLYVVLSKIPNELFSKNI